MPATRPGAPGQSSRTSNQYFHEAVSQSASELGDGSVFDEGEESETSGLEDLWDESEGDEEAVDPAAETTPAHTVSLRRIDTLSRFEQGVGVEVAVDASDQEQGPPLPCRLNLAGISRDMAEAAGEFLAGALIGVDTPLLRVTPGGEKRPQELPLLPSSKQSPAGAALAAEVETARGMPLPLPMCRVDTMDLLRIPTCELSPLLSQAIQFGIPMAEIPSVESTDSLDMLRLPSATPSPVLDRPVALKRQRGD
jgi:hypothetical protein